MARVAVALCALLATASAQCTVEKAQPYFSRSVYEFSVDLLTRLALDTDYHFVASPLSPWTLLAHTSLGAADATLHELNSVLRLLPHKCYSMRFFEIVRGIYAPAGQTTLEGASTIVVDERYPLNESFERQVKNAGITDVKRLPMDNYEYVAATVNNYVRTATNGAIDDVVQASDLENAVMTIVDVLRFKGNWQIPFPVEETEESSFYDEMNNKIGSVNLMFITSQFNFKSMDLINSTILEIPYSDQRFSMLLFLPYEGMKLSNVIYSLKEISLKSIFALFKEGEPQEISLQLPRFKITSDLSNLKELLVDMGLKSVFESRAQFPGISDNELYISNIMQKADIEVTEEGTTASGATTAEFTFKSLPYTVAANKPFFFMIVDKNTVTPVFAGAYSKPNLF
ncbi:unnamed protein product, partial [Iphiclides podalirius]